MRGEAYDGPKVETPRGLDGKPDLTGFWRPLKSRKAGRQPGQGRAELHPAVQRQLGKRALIYTQNHTVDPEALVRARRHSASQRERPAVRGTAHAGANRIHVQLQHQPADPGRR